MTIVTTVFVVTVLCYVLASGLFVVDLGRGGAQVESWATRALGAAVAVHCAYLGVDFAFSGRTPVATVHQTLAVLSLLIAVSFLATMRRHRLPVLGAFITPMTLLLLLAASFQGHVAEVPEGVRSFLRPLHVLVNILGLAAFALAFAVAVAYVIQEQLLRRRHVGGVFQRLPALDVLDSWGFRLVTIGFPLFTLGVVTGSIWAARLGNVLDFNAGQGFAFLAWVFFACVLLSRAAGGWRGRRAAIGTMLGFLCALAAIGGYVLRGVS
ncbi:MAG: cytochrome c biogenesis protein CcsA [Polyangiales bacterium]